MSNYFSDLINSYKETYSLKVQNYYEGFQHENYSYDEVVKSCNFSTNTIIVDSGDVSYLVLRPNKDPIKLNPFFDVSEDSVDSNYEGSLRYVPFVDVPNENFPMIRFLPGFDDFEYPRIENSFTFNTSYKKAFESYETMFITNEAAFKNLDLNAEKKYILGRKLAMSVLRMSDALDPMENLEIPDELKEIFVDWVAEDITEIYQWAAYDDDEEEDK
jgi:hypothetical protein